jgi:hypothetical protein
MHDLRRRLVHLAPTDPDVGSVSSDLKTTQRYMHLAPRVLEDAIHALEQPVPWQICAKSPASAAVLPMKKPGIISDSGLSEGDPTGTCADLTLRNPAKLRAMPRAA